MKILMLIHKMNNLVQDILSQSGTNPEWKVSIPCLRVGSTMHGIRNKELIP